MPVTVAEPPASTLLFAGSPRPRHQVAVVVLTQGDRPEALERALDSIRRQGGVDLQLVLVRNGAPDEPSVEATIVLPRNQGIPAGRNAGAEVADADVVVFLDDDAELVGDDALAAVHRRFCDHPNLGALALHVVDETGGPNDATSPASAQVRPGARAR